MATIYLCMSYFSCMSSKKYPILVRETKGSGDRLMFSFSKLNDDESSKKQRFLNLVTFGTALSTWPKAFLFPTGKRENINNPFLIGGDS